MKLPQSRERGEHEKSEYFDTPMLSLLEYLDEAVVEGRNEEKPFEKRSKHDRRQKRNIGDLTVR